MWMVISYRVDGCVCFLQFRILQATVAKYGLQPFHNFLRDVCLFVEEYINCEFVYFALTSQIMNRQNYN